MAQQILSQTQQQRMQLILAPQLRQSLEMLQVPVLELQTLIQNELQQNPTLEEKLTDSKDRLEVEPINDEKEEAAPEGDFDEQFEALAKLD
ncbi:MAG: RNA polymerase sigma-54 factor, partial [Anaerolineae bacterium]